MKKSMRILSGFLTSLLLLTGCSPAAQESSLKSQSKSEVNTNNTQTTVQTGKGMFVATKVSPEDNRTVRSMTLLADGSLVFYTENLSQKFVSQDNGLTWQASEGPQFDIEFDESNCTTQDDGTTYAVLRNSNSSDQTINNALKKISPDGSISDIGIPEVEAYREKGLLTYYNHCRFLGKDRLYIMGQYYPDGENDLSESFSGVYNTTTYEKIYDISPELFYGNEAKVVLDEDNMYVLQSAGAENYRISIRSLADGTEQRTIDLPQELDILREDILSQPKDGILYLAGREHIYEIDLASEAITDKGETARLPLSNHAKDIMSFILLSPSELLCSSYGGEIWRLVYDENYQPKEDNSLTVWSLMEDSELRDIASDYQDQNPDSIIKIESGFNFNQAMTPTEKEDCLRNFNTRLLAGEAIDVIVLDKMPAQQYAKQGVLSDLTNIIDTSDFMGDFANQLKINDSLYYVPIRWFTPVMTVRKDAVKDIPTDFDGWMNFIEKMPNVTSDYRQTADAEADVNEKTNLVSYNVPFDKIPFIFSPLQPIYDILWAANEPALIQNNKINEENMKSFLKAMKLLADKGGSHLEDDFTEKDIYEDKSLKYLSDVFFLPSSGSIYTGFILADMCMAEDHSILEEPSRSEKIQTFSVAVPSMAGGTWKPHQLLGISAKSTKKEAAAKFIQFTLSLSVQAKHRTESSLPITKTSHIQLIEKEKERYANWFANLSSRQIEIYKERDDMPKPELSYDAQVLFEFASQLKAPLITDYAVRNMIWEPMRDYTKNLISLEDAMNQINSKTKIYLSEKIQ